jgi:choline dehydrogenase-like flavoprotein
VGEIKNWKKMSSYYAMISPDGAGRVLNLPFVKSPFVTFNLTERDYYYINKGIYSLSKLLFEAGALKLFPAGNQAQEINSLEDVYKISTMKKDMLKLMTIHLFGSVQLSGNKSLGPINQDGNLWEDDTIYINDSSMLVDSPTVNPQGVVMAIARMNTLKFLNKL